MTRSDINVYGGFIVQIALRDGRVLEGRLEKESRKWWIGSEAIIPNTVVSIKTENREGIWETND